jgi:hypothetical protein
MKVASTSKTSVNFYQTIRRNNPEDSHLLCMTFACCLRNFVIKSYAYTCGILKANDGPAAPWKFADGAENFILQALQFK